MLVSSGNIVLLFEHGYWIQKYFNVIWHQDLILSTIMFESGILKQFCSGISPAPKTSEVFQTKHGSFDQKCIKKYKNMKEVFHFFRFKAYFNYLQFKFMVTQKNGDFDIIHHT